MTLVIVCHHYIPEKDDGTCGAPAAMMVVSPDGNEYFAEGFCARHAVEVSARIAPATKRGDHALVTLHPDDEGG